MAKKLTTKQVDAKVKRLKKEITQLGSLKREIQKAKKEGAKIKRIKKSIKRTERSGKKKIKRSRRVIKKAAPIESKKWRSSFAWQVWCKETFCLQRCRILTRLTGQQYSDQPTLCPAIFTT